MAKQCYNFSQFSAEESKCHSNLLPSAHSQLRFRKKLVNSYSWLFIFSGRRKGNNANQGMKNVKVNETNMPAISSFSSRFSAAKFHNSLL
jgi:hypothetical protein